ncbi:MAG: T9SS type A sorting domain-containing protein [Bacteroidia bacterium]|nr:T9SS type A sorting domain-containing protein [Bacteroidia bacterium]
MRKYTLLFKLLFCVYTTANCQLQITPILLDSGLYVHDIDVLSQDTMLFTSTSKIYRTTNGGASWDSIETNLPGSVSVDFLNFNIGVAVNYNSIKRTTNAGVTWDSLAFASTTSNRDCHIIDSSHFIVSNDSGYIRHVYTNYYVDDTLLDPLALGSPVVIFDFDFLDDSVGFGGGVVNGFSAVIHTADNGLTWDVRANSGFLYLYLHEISFVDSMVGWATQDSPGLWEHISFTTDGGYTWQSGYNYFDEKRMNGLDFSPSGLGLVLTKSGYIFQTINSGQSWDTAYAYQSGGPYGVKVKIVNDSVAYLGGARGIYKLTNLPTGIFENNINKIKIYPNPATSILNIQIPSNQKANKVEMYDMQGRLVLLSNAVNHNPLPLNVAGLTPGIYAVKVICNASTHYTKVVIEAP